MSQLLLILYCYLYYYLLGSIAGEYPLQCQYFLLIFKHINAVSNNYQNNILSFNFSPNAEGNF